MLDVPLHRRERTLPEPTAMSAKANSRLMHRSNASLFHRVGGAGKDRLLHGGPQRFRRFEVDHQFRPTEFVPGVMSRIVVNR
jgi:hypothetical protein